MVEWLYYILKVWTRPIVKTQFYIVYPYNIVYPYILNCKYFRSFRKLYIRPYYYKHPNTLKFSQLMNSNNKVELKKNTKFIKIITQMFVLDFPLSLLVLNRLSDKYPDFHVCSTFQLFTVYE